MKTPKSPLPISRQKLEDICAAITAALAEVVREPRTYHSRQLELRLRRLSLRASQIRNREYPLPSIETILLRAWKRGFQDTTPALH
jgi:hypothetical protein